MSASRSYLKLSFAPIRPLLRQAAGDVSRDNPVASVLVQADNDHDDMLATLNVRKPSREQFRGAEASAAAHLVGLGESRANPLSMFGKQTWMRLGYMRFALPAELDLTTDISAKKSRHTDEQD